MNVRTRHLVPSTNMHPDEKEDLLREVLDDIEYPGYEITLMRINGEAGGTQFFIQMRKQHVVDGRDPTNFLAEVIHYAMAVSGSEPLEDLVRAIFETIQMLELHEVAELFRFRGEQVYNPHRPVAQAVHA